jgi:hypothetical protein
MNAMRWFYGTSFHNHTTEEEPMITTTVLAIGDKVKAKAFTDCFGEEHPEITGLTVSRIQVIPESSIPSYRRITCASVECDHRIEASERFFEREMI